MLRRVTAPEPKSSRLPLTVLALGVTSFFTDVGGELIFPLLPAFLATLGAGPAFLGLLEGVADAVASGIKYASGAWVDRRPAKKPFVLLGYGLAGAVRPLIALATAPWHVLLVRVMDRVGKGLRSAPRDVLIAAAVPQEQSGRAFGFHRAMDHAGAVVGPLLGTALLAAGVPLRTVFALAIIPGVLAFVAVARVKEEPGPQRVLPATEPGAKVASPPLPKRLWSFLGILLLFALGNSSDAFLLLRAHELGTADAWLPMLWMALHLSKMAFTNWGGALSDRVPRHRLVIAGWLVYALCYLGFALAQQAWQAWALFLVYGLFYGLTEPVEKALIRDLSPETVRGRAFGLYHGSLGLAAVPAGLITGGLWQAFGPLAALGVGGVIALTAAVLLMVWARAGRVVGTA